MKVLFLAIIMICVATQACASSAELPIQARIVNLTLMPVEEAIAFCNEKGLTCPAIREKMEAQRAKDEAANIQVAQK